MGLDPPSARCRDTAACSKERVDRLRPAMYAINRLLKNGASGRDPALRGACECAHISRYAAFSKSPHTLADGLMLVSNPLLENRKKCLEKKILFGNKGKPV